MGNIVERSPEIDIAQFENLRGVGAEAGDHQLLIDKVDPTGLIIMVNSAWRRFAQANGDTEMKQSGPGANYLDACMAGNHADGSIASAAAQGLRHVLEGSSPLFSLQYPCHSPSEERWFVMNVAPVQGPDFGAVISHVNISSWFQQVKS